MTGHAEPLAYFIRAERVGDGDYGFHAPHYAKLFRKMQAKRNGLQANFVRRNDGDVNAHTPKPFADIADRLKWHRNSLGLTQEEYAEAIGVKRSRYSRWEAGSDRLSLDGALALRRKYGLSLDFLYEGNADALPMTLRNAWIERPASKS